MSTDVGARATGEATPDWVAWSAAALVTGSLLLTFGTMLNPAPANASPGQSLALAQQEGGRWLGMAAAYLLGSVSLTGGLPALAAAITAAPRGTGRRTGAAGLLLFAVGAIATTGYAALLVFFRALVHEGALRPGALDDAARDPAFLWVLLGWVGSFYLGVLLIGLSLLRARTVAIWVPCLMIVFVASLPVAGVAGQIGHLLQLLTLTVALTGVAMTVTGAHGPVGHRDDLIVPLSPPH